MSSASFSAHLRKEHMIKPAIINAIINGGIAYAIFTSKETIGLFDLHGMVLDTLLTVFLLTQISTWILFAQTRSKVMKGNADVMPEPLRRGQGFLAGIGQVMPASNGLIYSIALGTVATLIIAPMVFASFYFFCGETLIPMQAIIGKMIYTPILAALVSPITAIRAQVATEEKMNEGLITQ
ncbi:hypothetical protein EOPP23_00815 [Endozoicomonas sp. OPT23]|uniref:hypothetical protein n=1 Tax=Endozoicomonas sp. OPT23 TaxID=2072845 RepID=UPI00129A7C4A|nr:hypothetical protein [Endozoicomonas sp. OPT23]MRI31532.1 hypothetical protein [Endozoicomonas sp. OPT23]